MASLIRIRSWNLLRLRLRLGLLINIDLLIILRLLVRLLLLILINILLLNLLLGIVSIFLVVLSLICLLLLFLFTPSSVLTPSWRSSSGVIFDFHLNKFKSIFEFELFFSYKLNTDFQIYLNQMTPKLK